MYNEYKQKRREREKEKMPLPSPLQHTHPSWVAAIKALAQIAAAAGLLIATVNAHLPKEWPHARRVWSTPPTLKPYSTDTLYLNLQFILSPRGDQDTTQPFNLILPDHELRAQTGGPPTFPPLRTPAASACTHRARACQALLPAPCGTRRGTPGQTARACRCLALCCERPALP